MTRVGPAPALAAALALAAPGSAAFAGACPAVISGTDWDDGTRVTVSTRASDMLVLETGIAMDDGEHFPIRFRTQAGVIPLWNSGADGPVSHDWTTPLPSAADLVPGATFDLAGSLQAWGEVEPLALRLSVRETAELTVAGCSYPVTVIEMQQTLGAEVVPPVVVWLHLPSLLPLREESEAAPEPWAREVAALR